MDCHPDPTRHRAAGRRPSGKALVIVESPAKARTIGGLLGPDFVVESSVGHIRDLPRRADEVPAAYKGEGWARLGRRRRQRLQAALRGRRRRRRRWSPSSSAC